ncbi:MAG: hypothetical protein LH660_07685 [Phormidesmis sp. CAN_BIN36]|nr:hypothetical protein [Phormidesmis sp. CAN_BIN36]
MIDLVLNALLIACTPTPHAKLVPLNQISRPGPPSAAEGEVERRAITWGELMQTDAKRQLSTLKLNLKPEHIVYVMKMRAVWDSNFREESGFFYPTSKKIWRC